MSDDAPLTHGYECENCGSRWYYTRVRCATCGGGEWRTYRLERGELISETVAHVTPDGVREPNPLGMARFEGGVNVIAQVGEPAPAVGDSVELVGDEALRELDDEELTGPRLVKVD